MSERTKPIFEAVMVIVFIAACLFSVMSLFGCASCEPEVVYKPYKVEVPVQVPPPKIEYDQQPEWRVLQETTGGYLDKLRAVTSDLLDAWAHIAHLEWKIDNHNEAISE